MKIIKHNFILFIIILISSCVNKSKIDKRVSLNKVKQEPCEFIYFELDSSYQFVKDIQKELLAKISKTDHLTKINDSNFEEVDYILVCKKDKFVIRYAILKHSLDTLLLEASVDIQHVNFLSYFKLGYNKKQVINLLKNRYNISISNPKSNCFTFSPQSEFDALSLNFKNGKIAQVSYYNNSIQL